MYFTTTTTTTTKKQEQYPENVTLFIWDSTGQVSILDAYYLVYYLIAHTTEL